MGFQLITKYVTLNELARRIGFKRRLNLFREKLLNSFDWNSGSRTFSRQTELFVCLVF